MMAMQNEGVQRLFDEIQQKAAFSREQLGIVSTKIANEQRAIRRSELTIVEMDALPVEVPVYEGVGRMFVAASLQDVKSRLAEEGTSHRAELANLEKKQNYLETTLRNSSEHLEKILKGGGR